MAEGLLALLGEQKPVQAKAEQPVAKGGSSSDLFAWLDALFTKVRPEGTPPTFMMHRFLAADKDFAQVARYLAVEIKDPELIFGTWQAMLPKGRGAPRLQYVAPKKAAAEEELVTRMKATLSESRATVERMIAMIDMAGRLEDLYTEFGLEAP